MFCVVTRALATELLLCPLAPCGWDAVVLESVCLLFRVRHWCRQPCVHHSRGEALFPKGFGQRLHVITGLVLRGPSLLAVYLGWSGQSALDCFALQRLATPAAVAAYADQVPRGQRAPLDEFRALLIDRSAELMESFLSSRSRTWRRSREHQSSAHAADSSRDSSRFSRRGCSRLTIILIVGSQCWLISSFPSRLTAAAPSSSARSRLLSYPLRQCLLTLRCWAAADLGRCARHLWIGWSLLPSWALFRPRSQRKDFFYKWWMQNAKMIKRLSTYLKTRMPSSKYLMFQRRIIRVSVEYLTYQYALFFNSSHPKKTSTSKLTIATLNSAAAAYVIREMY